MAIAEPALIFIDEFGNAHLDLNKGGTFSHFIYCGLIFPQSAREQAECLRDRISKNHFFGQSLKSSKLGPKMFDRRLAALREILDGLDFTLDILVIDKSRLDQAEGLKYKPVFYKYFQNLFVTKYNQRFQAFEITADQVGEQFKYELQQYVRTHGVQTDLFNPDRAFHLKEDEAEEPLLQLADFLCGCVGKIFCASHAEERAPELLALLHARMSVSYFPYTPKWQPVGEADESLDRQIAEVTLNLIDDFYRSHTGRSSSAEYLRLLDYLLLNYKIENTRLVSTHEILSYLSQFFLEMSEERVRLIVRNLRYEGLFIVSHSGKSGYKIAANYHDIEEYFRHFSKYVIPMLQKIKILNETISANTFNAINPLEKDASFVQLKGLLQAIS
jgi:hypothetical protein